MEDVERTAIETEIATEQKIVTDAEAIIATDEAKLAADAAQEPADQAQAVTDVVAADPQAASQDPAADAPDPDGNPATADAQPGSSDGVTITASGGDLSESHVTPLPDNGPIAPIVADTTEAGAGEIVAPPKPEWIYPDQPPSMGRIVHYRAANAGEMPDGNEFHAAMITKVNEDWTISISVFPEGRNPMFVANAGYGNVQRQADMTAGTWMWPERV